MKLFRCSAICPIYAALTMAEIGVVKVSRSATLLIGRTTVLISVVTHRKAKILSSYQRGLTLRTFPLTFLALRVVGGTILSSYSIQSSALYTGPTARLILDWTPTAPGSKSGMTHTNMQLRMRQNGVLKALLGLSQTSLKFSRTSFADYTFFQLVHMS